MNPEQIRKRLAEILGLIEGMKPGETGLSEEQIAEVEKLHGEYGTLKAQLESAEKIEAMKTGITKSAGRKVEPAGATTVTVIKDHSERFGGFKSSGDFLTAVRDFARSGKVATQFQSAAYEKNGEDGGFLVPADISDAIVKKLEVRESLLSQTTSFQVSGNSLSLPIDESQPWNSGVQAYWVDEGGQLTQTKPAFKMADFKLKKLGAMVVCTDELLEDATALQSYIQEAAPAAIMHKINNAIISGDGIGKPTGILSSAFVKTITKESGQAADTIVAKNIIKMYAGMFPQARAGAVWLCNAQCEEQLLQMKDDLGNFIYLSPGSQMNQSPYGMLMGRPVIPMMSSMPALGDTGDIMLANLKYYYAIQKAGIKSAESIHVYFDTNKTAYRFTMRVDGRVPFQSAVTTQYGSYAMSAFVKVEDR